MVYSFRAYAVVAGVNTSSMVEQAFQYGTSLAYLLLLILSWDLLQLQCSLLQRCFLSLMR